MPDVFGRYAYYITFGGSILIGKMVTTKLRFGFIFLLILFMYDVYSINFSTDAASALSAHLHSEFQNPFYGLVEMMLNYDNILNFNF